MLLIVLAELGPRIILVCYGPVLVVELYNFVVDVVIDVRLGCRLFKGEVPGGAEFCHFVCFFVSPETDVGCSPSKFQADDGP